MKGIVLAGGTGSRLWPNTLGISKQLLPVFDKPLVYYPIGTLFLAGIREILIICTPENISSFMRLLGDGSRFGVQFRYEVQNQPNGIAEAFVIGEKFISGDKVALILGDNVFHGPGLGKQLREINLKEAGATIFAYELSNCENYGVVEFRGEGEIVSLEEKPIKPKSNYAVPGLYFYDSQVCSLVKNVKPSERNEMEITDLNREYLSRQMLNLKILNRGTAWFDCGTVESLHAATSYIQSIQYRQGSKISCIEEIAWKQGWINDQGLLDIALKYRRSEYGEYLFNLLKD